MLRIFCGVIPVLIIILHLILNQSILWLLTILFAMLGLMFSTVNFRFRKDRLSIVLLAANIGIFLYSIIFIIIEWTN